MSQLTRPDLDLLPTYVPGRSVPGAIKLASNEVPYGPLPGVVEADHRGGRGHPPLPGHGRGGAARDAGRAATASTRTGSPPAAARSRWPSTWLVPTCVTGDEMIFSWRSFEAYPIIAATTGATAVRVPEHGRTTATTCRRWPPRSPHGPGWCWSATRTTRPVRRSAAAELDAFLDAVPDTCWCARRGVPRVRHRPGRARTASRSTPTGRTWSCCVRCPRPGAWPACGSVTWSAQPDGGRRRPQGDHAVLHLQRRAGGRAGRARASGRDAAPGRSRGRRARPGARRRSAVWSRRCRRARPTSSGCRSATTPTAFAAACEAEGVIVRPFAGDGVRVTIGTPDENDAFLAAAEKALV